jgi:hypothetical protein
LSIFPYVLDLRCFAFELPQSDEKVRACIYQPARRGTLTGDQAGDADVVADILSSLGALCQQLRNEPSL